MRGRVCWLGLWIVFLATAGAQDVHFSHLDFHPALLNPASAGSSSYRIGAAYRSQWTSVSDPFRTFAFVADIPLWHSRYRRDVVGVGLQGLRDQAGTLAYGITAAAIQVAYHRQIGWNHRLSIGAEGGGQRTGYNTARADLYDVAETLDGETARYPTVGGGLAWLYTPDADWWLHVGVAAHHLNRPKNTVADGTSRLQPRYLLSLRSCHGLGDHWSLSPLMVAQWQHDAQEICMGGDARWTYDKMDPHWFSLSAGAVLRTGDAWIFSIEAEYRSLAVMLCYDANISGLSKASSGYGAMELGVRYEFNRTQKKRDKALPCPIL